MTGEWSEVRDSTPHVEPVPRHPPRRPRTKDTILRPAEKRVLLRQEQTQFRRHLVLLPERRTITEACQCAS